MNHTRQLDNSAYLRLTAAERGLLHDLRLDFARTRLELPAETLYLSRRLGYKVLRKQLESLSQAGFITLCSRTVLERFRNAFWNCSSLEVEEEEEQELLPSFQNLTTPNGSHSDTAADGARKEPELTAADDDIPF